MTGTTSSLLAPLPAHPHAPASAFTPLFAGFDAKCRAQFAAQPAMVLVGGHITALSPGFCEVSLPFDKKITQQVGYLHGGVVSMIADSACGFAALSGLG
jgi:acyl-coenzyme A thioesterase PaaI-like protein